MTTFTILGINDDITTCEKCGKSNLKCTVVMESEQTGIVHYGRDCAAQTLLGAKSRKNNDTIDRLAKAVSYARKWLPLFDSRCTVEQWSQAIASKISLRYCRAWSIGSKVFIQDVGEVKA